MEAESLMHEGTQLYNKGLFKESHKVMYLVPSLSVYMSNTSSTLFDYQIFIIYLYFVIYLYLVTEVSYGTSETIKIFFWQSFQIL